MKRTVYHYSPNEVEAALNVLNLAIENHRRWSDNLHISILCKQPFAKDILDEAAHKQCAFGQWYYGEVSESIRCIKEFNELEPVHKYMHDHARHLANEVNQKKEIELEEYQTFLTNQHRLIDLLTSLRDILIQHEHCFDALTGAINRKSVSLLLEQSFENFSRYEHVYSIAMLDVDFFKKINDQYGHVTGDQVLKHISIFFGESLRRTDCVGRYGGEEFIIIFPETRKELAFDLMDKSRIDLANKKIIVGSSSIDVTVSIGVTEVMSADEDAWQAVKRADLALYEAKSAGRNCVK